jgi:hypothetical protein
MSIFRNMTVRSAGILFVLSLLSGCPVPDESLTPVCCAPPPAQTSLTGTGTSVAGTGFNAAFAVAVSENLILDPTKKGTSYVFASCSVDAAGTPATYPCALLFTDFNSATGQVEDVAYQHYTNQSTPPTSWGVLGTTPVPGLSLGDKSVAFTNVKLQGNNGGITTDLTLNGSLTLGAGLPASPKVTVSSTNGVITLTWNAVPGGVTSYNIYSETTPGNASFDPNVSVTTASPKTVYSNVQPFTPGQTITATVNASASGTYYYAVTAVNASGESPISSYPGHTAVTLSTDPKFYIAEDGAWSTYGSLGAYSVITGERMADVASGIKAVAINKANKKAYVGTYVSSSTGLAYVKALDTVTNTIVATISLPPAPPNHLSGKVPYSITVDETRNLVYVSNDDGTVSIINGATDTLIGYTADLTGTRGVSIKANSATGKVYAIISGVNASMVIFKYDAATNTYSNQTVPLNMYLYGGPIDIDPATNTLYFAQSGSSMLVIDGATNTVTTEINLGATAGTYYDVALSPSTGKAYAAVNEYLHVIDMTTNTVTNSIPLGLWGVRSRVSISPVNGYVIVANEGDRAFKIYDPATGVLNDMPYSSLNGWPVLVVASP